MVYSQSGSLIKYKFCCKGMKEGDRFDSKSVERFYTVLDKAKQILENARPTTYYERKFTLAMDKLDELLCVIEEYDKLSEREIALEALQRELATSLSDKGGTA